MARVPANIADHVGGTPLVRLTRVAPETAQVELYAKLEALNPGGSVKDRIGVSMIEAAEREGRIARGRTTVVEPRAATPASRWPSCARPRATTSSSRCPRA